MTTDNRKIQIETAVDASGAKAGFQEVKVAATEMATGVAQAGESAGKSIENLGTKASGSGETMDRATRSMVQSIERATAAFSAGSKSSSEYYRVLAQQRGIDPAVLEPFLAQLDKVAPKAKAAEAAVASLQPVAERVGMSAKATAAAMRQVPAQFTDIVVGLQGGQNPLTVLLQQGGQLKDMFGGVGGAASALGKYLLGLVNPYTVVAAAVGVLALAYHQGAAESDAMFKSLVMSGNAAGTTTGQMRQMSVAVAQAAGVTKGAASDALTQLAATGVVAGSQMSAFAVTAVKASRDAGQSVADTVKAFADLGKDPVSASTRLNESMNYLSAATVRLIHDLEEQGKKSEAAAVAQKAYADALSNRADQLHGNMGTLERAWEAVKNAAKGAWDAMLDIGRATTPEENAEKLRGRLAEMERIIAARRAGGRSTGRDAEGFAALQEQAKQLREQLSYQTEISRQLNRGASAAAMQADAAKAMTEWLKQGDEVAQKNDKRLKEREQATNLAKRLGSAVKPEELAQRLRDIDKKYEDKDAINKAKEEAKAKAKFDVDLIQKTMEGQVAAYTNGEKLIDQLHQAGKVSDADYYKSKIDLTTRASEITVDAYEREKDRLQAQKLDGKDAIDRDREVADLAAKIAKEKENSAMKVALLNQQATDAVEKQAQAYRDLVFSFEMYADALARTNAQAAAGAGRGNQFRTVQAGADAINNKFDDRVRQLNLERDSLINQGKDTTSLNYDAKLAAFKAARDRELIEYKAGVDQKIKLEQDWKTGAADAMADYADNARNVAEQTKQMFTSAFKGMEDSLVNFVMTGKLNFTQLANSIIADLVRIAVRQSITAPLAAAFGMKMFADGGDPPVGVPSIVGERGPEIFVPKVAGTIIPNHAITTGGSIGGSVTVQVIEAPGQGGTQSQSTDSSGNTLIKVLVESVKSSVASDILRGNGSVPSALASTYGLNRAAGAY